MEEKLIFRESSLTEEDEDTNSNHISNNHEWKLVSELKRKKKTSLKPTSLVTNQHKSLPIGSPDEEKSNVFALLVNCPEDMDPALETQTSRVVKPVAKLNKLKPHSDDDVAGSVVEIPLNPENGTAETKSPKEKPPNATMVTFMEAASKIDAADLSVFLNDISASYGSKERYLSPAFSTVSTSQFQWVEMFRESTVAKMAEIPRCFISVDVYKTSVDWINRSSESIFPFVSKSLDILLDLAYQQGVVKSKKKVVQHKPSKDQVSIFVVLALVLQEKPDVLISLAPTLKEDPKYQGHEKLPFIVWMIAQAYQGDLVVGMYSWAHNLLPIVCDKSSHNPQSRDKVLQLVERILSTPRAQPNFLSSPVKGGKRLLPPSEFDLLMRATFPESKARVKATERFEKIYPFLKELALACSPGNRAMRPVTLEILNFTLKSAGENIPELSMEAAGIFIWCLTQNPDCYKQWDNVYLENLEASVVILRKLYHEWNEHSTKHSSLDPLRKTLKSFMHKNEKALASGVNETSIKKADKYCNAILGKSSHGHKYLNVAFAAVTLALGAVIMSPNIDSWDLKNFSLIFTSLKP